MKHFKKLFAFCLLTFMSLGALSAQDILSGPEIQSLLVQLEEEVIEATPRIGEDNPITWMGIMIQNQPLSIGSLLQGSINEILLENGLFVVVSAPDENGRIINPEAEILFFAQATMGQGFITMNFQIVQNDNQRLLATWSHTLEPTPAMSSLFMGAEGSNGSDFGEPDSLSAPRPWPGIGTFDGLSFHSDDEGDYYLFDMSEEELGGNFITIETTGRMDTYLEIYDANSLNRIASNDDGGQSSNARVNLSTEDLPFVVEVRPYSRGNSGDYGLRIGVENISRGDDEPNDRIESALIIDPDQAYASRLFPMGDRDYYQIQNTNEEFDSILMVETASDMDTTLTLYDSDFQSINYDDDSGMGGNARISILNPGTHYILVEAYGDDTGEYSLIFNTEEVVRDEFEPDNSPEEATPLEIGGGSYGHTLTPQGDYDLYRFTVTEPGDYTMETLGDIDTYMYLYRADQMEYELRSDDDGGVDYNARIQSSLSPGEYIIWVEPLGSAADYETYGVELYFNSEARPPIDGAKL